MRVFPSDKLSRGLVGHLLPFGQRKLYKLYLYNIYFEITTLSTSNTFFKDRDLSVTLRGNTSNRQLFSCNELFLTKEGFNLMYCFVLAYYISIEITISKVSHDKMSPILCQVLSLSV